MNLQNLTDKELISLYKEKKETKEKYNVSQNAHKTLINSAYGGLGNEYFQYYSSKNAEAVTMTGQLVIKWAEQRLNQYFNKILGTENKDYIIAIDTDSVYICLAPLIEKLFKPTDDKQRITDFFDKFCKEKIDGYISDFYKELFEYTNGYQNQMAMKREIISNKAVWTGKKRYFANVLDSEGVRYDKAKIKVTGLEIVKSSTPAICREALQETLNIILNGSQKELIDYIDIFHTEFCKAQPNEIAFPKSVNDVSKYTHVTKSVPIHVRASINYNSMLKKLKLTNTYEEIKDGNKIKFVYLKMPNSIQEDVIAFPEKLPKEFDLHKYIDYDLMFEKTFLNPLRSITDAIGWNTEEKSNLATHYLDNAKVIEIKETKEEENYRLFIDMALDYKRQVKSMINDFITDEMRPHCFITGSLPNFIKDVYDRSNYFTGQDIDIFLKSTCTVEMLDRQKQIIADGLVNNTYIINGISKNALCFECFGQKYQFITSNIGTPKEVTDSFDMDHVKWYYDLETDSLHIDDHIIDCIMNRNMVFSEKVQRIVDEHLLPVVYPAGQIHYVPKDTSLNDVFADADPDRDFICKTKQRLNKWATRGYKVLDNTPSI